MEKIKFSIPSLDSFYKLITVINTSTNKNISIIRGASIIFDKKQFFVNNNLFQNSLTCMSKLY